MPDFIEAPHWSKVTGWRWPNFSPQELACRGTGRIKISVDLMDRLQRLRKRLGKPIIINSGYRSPAHNKAVGGAPNSQHVKGQAVDCRMDNHDPAAFEAAARAEGFTGFGFYPKQGFMHIDIGPKREWGTRWKKGVAMFKPETKMPEAD